MVPLDLSKELKTPYPVTGPSVLANFVRIEAGESITTSADATSEFFYVIKGRGHTETENGLIEWSEGDIFVLPGVAAVHQADVETAFYMVNDSPLLAYLGVEKSKSRFRPTLYTRDTIMTELERAKNDPDAGKRSRVSVLLANKNFDQTLTITHTLWSMFGIVPPGTRQLPHRHQSVALDFAVEAKAGVYTLIGPELNADGYQRCCPRGLGERRCIPTSAPWTSSSISRTNPTDGGYLLWVYIQDPQQCHPSSFPFCVVLCVS